MNRTFFVTTALIMVFGTLADLSAKTWEVNSSSSYSSAYSSAATGDSTIWADGVYLYALKSSHANPVLMKLQKI